MFWFMVYGGSLWSDFDVKEMDIVVIYEFLISDLNLWEKGV